MSPGNRRLAALLATVAVGVGAITVTTGGSDRDGARALPEGGSGFRSSPARAGAPAGASTPRERKQERRIDAQLPVPLERAAARLFLVGFPGTTTRAPLFARLRQREWGAVLVDRANVAGTARLRALIRELDGAARRARHVPPLVAAVQLGGGEVTIAGVGPARQSAIDGAAAAATQARTAGAALRRRGFGLVLAPSADLSAAGGPWEGRGFSDDPAEAAQLVAGAVGGWRSARIAPVVGHFPGEGAGSQDPELGVATVGLSRGELRAREQLPFRAVARTAPAIQLSGALFAGFDAVTPATLDPEVVRALRRDGFRGAVVSANRTPATLATGEGVGPGAVAALRAGCDVLFVPGDRNDQEEAYRAVVQAVRLGAVPVARLRDALAHVDALRRAAG